MYNYKITKYSLENKGKTENIFDEWTSISDIGKKYNGREFLYEDYIKVENSYIEAILMFINLNDIKYITIDELEKHTSNKDIYDEYDIQIEDLINTVENRIQINICDIDLFIRAILREKNLGKTIFR